jgi:hypothetical protein
MKKMFFTSIFLICISCGVKCQNTDPSLSKKYFDNQTNYYKLLNEIKDQFIMTQFINDSLKNVELSLYKKNSEQICDSISYIFLDKFNVMEEKRKKDIKRLKTKNFILILSLATSIMIISFIQ